MQRRMFRGIAVLAVIGLSSLSSDALIGPPPVLTRGTVDVGAEVGRIDRQLIFDGTVGTSTIQRARLNSTQTTLGGRVGYAVSDNFHIRLLAASSRLNLGKLTLAAGGVSQGVLDLEGNQGFCWGVGGDFVTLPWSNAPDLRIGVSAEYRHYQSGINQGQIEVNEFRGVLKAARSFDRLTPYGGVMFSGLDGSYRGATSLGVIASGNLKSDDMAGILVGAEYAFTPSLKGRIEAEFVSSTGVNLGFVYSLGGPYGQNDRRVREPAPSSADAVQPMEPPPSVATEAEPPPPTRRPAAPVPEATIANSEPPTAIDVPPAVERRVKPPTPPPPRAERPARPVDERSVAELVELGNDLAALGRYDEAIVYYNRAVVANPRDFRAVYNLATSQYMSRDYAGARRSYVAAVGLKPDDAEANLFLGFCHYRLDDIDGAVRSWQRVLEIDPNNAVALNNLQALGR